MSRPVLRFLLPLAPFLALAAAYGYEQGIETQPKCDALMGGTKLFLAAILVIFKHLHLFIDVGE